MVGTTSDWKDELGRWLDPFWIVCVTKRGGRCVHFMWRVCVSVPAIARAFSRWRSGLRRVTMINCTILFRLASGTRRHWRQNVY